MGNAAGMDVLREYLNGLPTLESRSDFARRCGTTLGYLRKAMSVKQQLSEGLVIAIDRESGGAVPVEKLRPDVDWAHLRESLSMTSRRCG